MPDMPEQQLQQKVQNLEKIEQYLKQQVSDLEGDRQELYDLLREDKVLIHDLRIKVRTLELSEENMRNRYDRMFDNETKLTGDVDNLKDKINELKLLLSIQTKKAATDKSQITDPYESDQLQYLKSQLIHKDNEIQDLTSEIETLERQAKDRLNDDKTSSADKIKGEEDLKKLKELMATKDSDLNNTTQDKEKALEKLRTIQMDLLSAETTRDEKAGILLNKLFEITQLKKNIADKDQEVETLWTDMNKIRNNYSNYIETSETERALLENRLKDLMREIKLKGDDLEMAKKENDKLSEKLKKKDDEIMALINDKNETTTECIQMKKKLKEKEDEMKLLLEDKNNQQSKNAALMKDHEKIQEESERNLERQHKNDLKVLRDKNIELTNQTDVRDSKIKLLTSKNSDLEDKIKSIEDEYLQFKNEFNRTELQNELINSANEEKMRTIANTILKYQAEKKAEDTTNATQILFLEKSLQNKDEEIKLLTDDINNLHKKYLESLQRSSKPPDESRVIDNSSSRLNSELSRKDDEIKILMGNKESLQKRVFDLMGIVQEMKDTSDNDRTRLERELKDKTMTLEDKSKKLDEAEREIKDSKLKLNEYENKMADLKEKLIQVTNALKTSSQHNKELLIHQTNATRLAHEKDELEKQMDDLKMKHFNEFTILKDKFQSSEKERIGIERSLQESKLRLTKLESEVSQKNLLQMKVNELITSDKQKDRQLVNMSEKVNTMRNDINKLLNDKRNFIHKEGYYNNLQREFDQLNTASQKQAQDLKNLKIKERDLSVQLKQKDLLITGLNQELTECMELSRKLNILNMSR